MLAGTARHPRCKKRLLARRALGQMGDDLGGGKLARGPKESFDLALVDQIEGIHVQKPSDSRIGGKKLYPKVL